MTNKQIKALDEQMKALEATPEFIQARQQRQALYQLAVARAENAALKEQLIAVNGLDRAIELVELLGKAIDNAERDSWSGDFVGRLNQLMVEALGYAENCANRASRAA